MGITFDPVDDADALFDANFLRWYHLRGKPALCEITNVERDVELTLPGGRAAKKPVVYLKQVQGSIAEIKPLVLNATNKNLLAEFLGRRPSEWKGKQIVLFQDVTKLRGKDCPCIRVRQPKNRNVSKEPHDQKVKND